MEFHPFALLRCPDRQFQHEAAQGAATAFEAERKPNAAAIQHMALENYQEMRDRVDDPEYLLQRALELALQERHPTRFVPHYAMVTFMLIRYALALHRSELQRELLIRATAGIDRLEDVDWAAVDADVLRTLEPLHDGPEDATLPSSPGRSQRE